MAASAAPEIFPLPFLTFNRRYPDMRAHKQDSVSSATWSTIRGLINKRLPEQCAHEKLSDDAVDQLRQTGRVRKLEPQGVLTTEATHDENLYLLMEGELEIVKEYEDADRVIGYIQPGEWVGEIAFLKKVPRLFSVRAVAPSAVLVLEHESFDRLEEKLRVQLLHVLYTCAAQRINSIISIEEELIDRRAKILYTLRSASGRTGLPPTVEATLDSMPRLPVYAGNLVSYLQQTDFNFDTVAEIILEDPSLAAQVLKNVNSPYFGFEQKIVDVRHAVTLLGATQVYLLVLYNAMRTTMPNTPPFINLQRHSVIMSCVAVEVARKVSPAHTSLAGTLGLLHDIGESVILLMQERFPTMRDILPLLDSAALGRQLLLRWNLPEEIYESIGFQSLATYSPIQSLEPEFQQPVMLLKLSHAITERLTGKAACPPIRSDSFAEKVDLLTTEVVRPELKRKARMLPQVVRNIL
ncbi:MAG: HDOD domain-containing protein [Desulfovibrionales bacterium]